MHKPLMAGVAAIVLAVALAPAGAQVPPTPPPGAAVKKDSMKKDSTQKDAAKDSARADDKAAKPAAPPVVTGESKGEVVPAAPADAVRETFVKAGRAQPRGPELERAAALVAEGATAAQVEALVKAAPADRSLVVALDVIAALGERGVAVADAFAQVGAQLAAGATDEALLALPGKVQPKQP